MSGFLAEGVPVTIDDESLREVVSDPRALAAWCDAHPEDPRAVSSLRMLGRLDEAAALARRSLDGAGLPPLVRAVRRARYAQVLHHQGAFLPADEQFDLAAEETGLEDPTSPSSLSVLAAIFQHRATSRFDHARAEQAEGRDLAAARLRDSALEDARRALAMRSHLSPGEEDLVDAARQVAARIERDVRGGGAEQPPAP